MACGSNRSVTACALPPCSAGHSASTPISQYGARGMRHSSSHPPSSPGSTFPKSPPPWRKVRLVGLPDQRSVSTTGIPSSAAAAPAASARQLRVLPVRESSGSPANTTPIAVRTKVNLGDKGSNVWQWKTMRGAPLRHPPAFTRHGRRAGAEDGRQGQSTPWTPQQERHGAAHRDHGAPCRAK